MSLRGWFEDHVLALLSTTIAREGLAVSVTLGGLYKIDPSILTANAEDSEATDTLERMPVEEKQRLSLLALPELYPFMRELVFRTSSSILPNSAIMLAPAPPQPECRDESTPP